MLKECQEKGLYPPNIKITIISEPTETIVFPLRFEGCTEDSNLDGDLMLPLGENVISCIKINLPCGTLILIPCVCIVKNTLYHSNFSNVHAFRKFFIANIDSEILWCCLTKINVYYFTDVPSIPFPGDSVAPNLR